MALSEIPAGSAVYVDANVFVYHFTGRSDDCSSMFVRMEAGELQAFTRPASILVVMHRLMMLEATERGLPVKPNPAARLAKQPRLVRQLSKYYFSVLAIPKLGVQILPLPPDFATASQEFRQQNALLVNDSLVPMHMRQAGLSVLASADAAFDMVAGIRRFAPVDI